MPEQKTGLMEGARQRLSKLAGRVSWPLAADGKTLAADNLQDKTRAQIRDVLRATLADPALVAELGIVDAVPKPAAPPPPDVSMVELAHVALEIVSRGAVQLARKQYADRIADLAGLTTNERETLAPLVAKVADKYIPDTLGKYADEINLCAALVHVGAAKVRLMKEADAKERANPVAAAA